jgi:hypothetical protein
MNDARRTSDVINEAKNVPFYLLYPMIVIVKKTAVKQLLAEASGSSRPNPESGQLVRKI